MDKNGRRVEGKHCGAKVHEWTLQEDAKWAKEGQDREMAVYQNGLSVGSGPGPWTQIPGILG